MWELWRRLRTNWNRVDTLIVLTSTAAFGLFIGNCWWESIAVCYLAMCVPIALQLWSAGRRRGTLWDAQVFGLAVAALWPIGEGFTVRLFGWWGEYLAKGPAIWDTPLYCVLVGWQASAYCTYAGSRTRELGYDLKTACFFVGLTAFLLGTIGENLFVGARMWVYDPSDLQLWSVPTFVPVGYGIAYSSIPLLRRFHPVVRAVLFGVIAAIVILSLGLATGFFPR